MKKALFVLSLILVVGYLIVGVAAWHILPGKIAEAEQKRVAVEMAIARIVNDQLAVSRRVNEITAGTLGKGRTKVEQVSEFLGDHELNRIALTYTGSDWANVRSAFLGSVQHSRELLKMQKEDRGKYVSRLNEKISELEREKRRLLRESVATCGGRGGGGASLSQEQWRRRLDDIDRQLASYRSSNTYIEYLKKDQTADREIVARAKNEEALFKMANEYEQQTVGQLNKIMVVQVTQLRQDAAEPERIRHQMSYFNIWPLNKLAAMPLPGN